MNHDIDTPALGPHGARLYSGVMDAYHIDDPASLAVLRSLCECLDLIHDCRSQVQRDGLMVAGAQGQPVKHPLLSIEMDARRALLAHARALRLDLSGEDL